MPFIQRRGAVDKVALQRTLLKRYVDLAFAKGDQIMVSTKLGTAVTCSVVDYFTFFLATPITKGVEGVTMASVRAVRRVQAQQLFAAIDVIGAKDLQILTTRAIQQGEPSDSWLGNQIFAIAGAAAAASAKTVTYTSSAAADSGISGSASVTTSGSGSAAASTASAAAGAAASTALGTATSVMKDVFIDYVADAVFDQVAALAPGGLGAVKASGQVMQVTTRINTLQAQISQIKKLAA